MAGFLRARSDMMQTYLQNYALFHSKLTDHCRYKSLGEIEVFFFSSFFLQVHREINTFQKQKNKAINKSCYEIHCSVNTERGTDKLFQPSYMYMHNVQYV